MRYLVLIFLLVAVILSGGCAGENQNTLDTTPKITPTQTSTTNIPTLENKFIQYENLEMGFLINYDNSWNVTSGNLYYGVTRFSSPSGNSAVLISKWPYYGNFQSIDQMVKSFSDIYAKNNITTLESGVIEGARYPTGFISDKQIVMGTEFKGLQYLVQARGDIYIIRYYSSDVSEYTRYERMFKDMFQSFEVF